jgi:hypothetical protein
MIIDNNIKFLFNFHLMIIILFALFYEYMLFYLLLIYVFNFFIILYKGILYNMMEVICIMFGHRFLRR